MHLRLVSAMTGSLHKVIRLFESTKSTLGAICKATGVGQQNQKMGKIVKEMNRAPAGYTVLDQCDALFDLAARRQRPAHMHRSPRQLLCDALLLADHHRFFGARKRSRGFSSLLMNQGGIGEDISQRMTRR